MPSSTCHSGIASSQQRPSVGQQIPKRDPAPRKERVSRPRNQREVIVEHFLAVEIGPGHPLVQHREEYVEIARIERRQELRERPTADLHLESRPPAGDAAHRLRHHPVEHARPRRHADRDRARSRPPEVAQLLGRPAELCGDAARAFVEHRPEFGQAHPARSAVQQLRSDLILERPKAFAERRLGDVHAP